MASLNESRVCCCPRLGRPFLGRGPVKASRLRSPSSGVNRKFWCPFKLFRPVSPKPPGTLASGDEQAPAPFPAKPALGREAPLGRPVAALTATARPLAPSRRRSSRRIGLSFLARMQVARQRPTRPAAVIMARHSLATRPRCAAMLDRRRECGFWARRLRRPGSDLLAVLAAPLGRQQTWPKDGIGCRRSAVSILRASGPGRGSGQVHGDCLIIELPGELSTGPAIATRRAEPRAARGHPAFHATRAPQPQRARGLGRPAGKLDDRARSCDAAAQRRRTRRPPCPGSGPSWAGVGQGLDRKRGLGAGRPHLSPPAQPRGRRGGCDSCRSVSGAPDSRQPCPPASGPPRAPSPATI